MKIQEFNVGPRFIFGEDAISELSNLSIKKAYIVCDPYMAKSGMIHHVLDHLDQGAVETKIFSGVVPNPTVESISKSISEIRAFKPDTIIALGGGSALDSSKAIILTYTSLEKVSKPTLIAIPTTSGSGSEITSFAVISDLLTEEKYALVDDSLVPDIAILDTVFTMTVPPAVTADSGMDVLTHCLEAYVADGASDFSDACAEKAIVLAWENLPLAYKDGNNKVAREKMHNASSLAGISFNNAGLGICHSLSHAIGAFFHSPHGRINTVLLPYVIAFNSSLSHPTVTPTGSRYAKVASMLQFDFQNEKEGVEKLISGIKQLSAQFGIKGTLDDLGIDKSDFIKHIPEMAERALADACTPANPRKVTKSDLESIYYSLARSV